MIHRKRKSNAIIYLDGKVHSLIEGTVSRTQNEVKMIGKYFPYEQQPHFSLYRAFTKRHEISVGYIFTAGKDKKTNRVKTFRGRLKSIMLNDPRIELELVK